MNKTIILAAGEGKRMKSKKSKVLHTLLHKPMIEYVFSSLETLDMKEIIIVAGDNIRQLQTHFEGRDVHFVRQYIGSGYPYGTGYAVSLCVDQIDDDDDVLIMAGDMPLIRQASLEGLYEKHRKIDAAATVLTACLDNPFGYGRIIRDIDGAFVRITEERDCTDEEKQIKEFNSSILIVRGNALKKALQELSSDNDQNELYLTDIFEILHRHGERITTYCLEDAEEVNGINSKAQLSFAEEILRQRVNRAYMEQGVILENPATILIEPGVVIGQDTYIGAFCRIIGQTRIGEDCVITGATEIVDSEIADHVRIQSSVLEGARMESGSDIGPYSHLRKGAVIKSSVHIGNFCEVKNAVLDEKTKCGHLAYVGDADVGKNVNIGCGVIFANYDGKNKFRTQVGDDSFIGSNANLVAPVDVQDNTFIAAGSTITATVHSGDMAIARARQENKKDWFKKKKEGWQ